MVGKDITSCSTQVANAREKAKDSRERRKGRHTRTRQAAQGEDKNVDWPQIESRPFITLHLCTFSALRSVDSLLRFDVTVNQNRVFGPSLRCPPSSPSFQFSLPSSPLLYPRIKFAKRSESLGETLVYSHKFANVYRYKLYMRGKLFSLRRYLSIIYLSWN